MSQKELSRCLSHTEIFRAQEQLRALPYLPVIPGSRSPLWLQSGPGAGRAVPSGAEGRPGVPCPARPWAKRPPLLAVRCKGSG